MNALQELVNRGGPAVIAIMVLSVVLYTRCFTLLLGLRRAPVDAGATSARAGDRIRLLQRQQGEMREGFRRDRLALGAMIAAAPLLGLLGTVSGMVHTFESLSSSVGRQSMEGLAGGIAEVLVATESGLAVALPAMLFVYLAHRLMIKRLQELNRLETGLREGRAA